MRCGIRETLRSADDIALVGEASRGDEAQRLCRELQPDVLLLDLQMPGATATETIKYVQEACRATRVIILTAYDDEVYVRGMLAAGAMGYILKDEVADVIITAIKTVMQGAMWLSRRISVTLMGQQASHVQEITPHVTARERSVLRLLAAGYTQEHIAIETQLSLRTVQRVVTILETKLNAPSLFILGRRSGQMHVIDE